MSVDRLDRHHLQRAAGILGAQVQRITGFQKTFQSLRSGTISERFAHHGRFGDAIGNVEREARKLPRIAPAP